MEGDDLETQPRKQVLLIRGKSGADAAAGLDVFGSV